MTLLHQLKVHSQYTLVLLESQASAIR